MHAAPTQKLPSTEEVPIKKSEHSSSGLPLWMYRLGYSSADTKKAGYHRSLAVEKDLREKAKACEADRVVQIKEKKKKANTGDENTGYGFSTAEERKVIEDLENKIDDLKTSNEDLVTYHTKMTKKNQQCEEDVETARKQVEAITKAQVEILEKQLQRAEDRYTRMVSENAGARRILLLEVLRQRRARNYALRKALQLAVPEDQELYEESLVKLHKISEKADGFPDDVLSIPVRPYTRRRSSDSLLNSSKNGGVEGVTLDDAISAITSNWEAFSYDPVAHKDSIFIPPTMNTFEQDLLSWDPYYLQSESSSSSKPQEDGVDTLATTRATTITVSTDDQQQKQQEPSFIQRSIPSYFGRTGNPPPVKGILDQTQQIRLTLSQALRIIVRTAFCALRTNNPNFTVPYTFLRSLEPLRNESVSQNLALVVSTPMIQFCSQCSHTIQTKEFQLACDLNAHLASGEFDKSGRVEGKPVAADAEDLIATPEKITSVYGSLDFWKTRSRVRFSPKVLVKADEYMRKHHLRPNTTIAVDFKRSHTWEDACKTRIADKTLPLKHYIWIAGMTMKENNGDGGTMLEVSANNTLDQCYPSLENLRRGVIAIAQQREYIETVFIAADLSEQDLLQSALAEMDFGPINVLLSFPHDVMQDAVEMQIMSHCDSILVNRFSEHSEHITELYLMQKKFNRNGVNFF
jgi:hypothetical protein